MRRVAIAGGDEFVGDVLELSRGRVASVLDDDLEAAGGAQAVDRGASKTFDQAVA